MRTIKVFIGIVLAVLVSLPASAAWKFNPHTNKLDYYESASLTISTDCSAVTTEGAWCWDSDNDTFYVGTGAAALAIGPGSSLGDVTDVFDCNTGNCQELVAGASDGLNMAAASYSIPFTHSADCSAVTAEGRTCWDTDDNILYVGDGSTQVKIIKSGAIVNADIAAAAAIAFSKLAALSDGNILVGSAANVATSVAVSGDVTIANTGAVTIAANSVALSTDTTGNFVATIADAGSGAITVANSGSENAGVTLDLADNAVTEAKLKAVDSATDEDVLTYESTTGDFEWHSRNEVASGATIVTYADGALVDFSGITQTGSTDEGLVLPAWADVTPTSNKKFLAASGNTLKLYNGGWVTFDPATLGAPTSAKYIVQAEDATLTEDYVLTAGTGMDIAAVAPVGGTGGTMTVTFDSTEIGTTTWGSGSAIVWTHDASGGTDATMTFGDNSLTYSGALTVTGSVTANGGIVMGTGDGFTVNSVNLLSGDELDGTKIKDADYGDVTISAAGAWAVEDDSHAHGSTTITLAAANLTDGASVAHIDAAENISGTWEVQDGVSLNFGNDADWGIAYDETTDDSLEISTAKTGAAAAGTPMLKIMADSGNSGMTADQLIFGIYKYTTKLFSVDEDGDVYIAGSITTQASTDPAVVLDESTANDTDYWFGVNADQEGDNDDYFEIGTGTTVGSNRVLRIDPSGNLTAEGYAKADYIILEGGTYDTTIQPGTPSANVSYTWPTAAPASNGYVLSGTTAGVLSWAEMTATAAGSDTHVQYNASGSLGAEAAFAYNATNNTLSLTQSASNPTLQVGDGTYSWNHTPQVGIEGVLETDANYYANGGIVLGSDGTVTTAGEIGYTSGAFTLFGANSENAVLTVGSAANTNTFSSGTSATYAFTPAVAFAGGLTLSQNADTITHSGSTSLTVASTSGTVIVESVTFTGDAITGVSSLTVGALTGVNSIDATGAVDMDYGSADVTDHTFVSDGGTVVIDGSVTAAAGVNLGTSQALIGTTAMTIGNNNQTVAINSSDWDIGATGDVTGLGAIGADGLITFTNATEASAVGTAAVVLSGGLGVAKDVWIGDDVALASDGAILNFGADSDVTLTHVADTGLTLNLDLTIGGSDLTLNAAGVKLTGDGDGALTILGLGDGYDEDLTINLDDTENKAVFSSSTGVTELNFSALNLATTGTIQGAVKINSDANGMSSAEMTAAGLYGSAFFATGAGTWALPGAAAGMSFCIYSTTAAAVVVNPDDGDAIVLNGTALSAGDSITSASGAGDFICLMAYDANTWYTLGRSGTWTDTN